MASLQHLGGDRWRVRVFAGTDPGTGKQRIVSRKFDAKGERAAKRQAAKVETEIRAELERKTVRSKTINGLLDDWLAIKRRALSPTTIAGYEDRATKIRKKFGRLPADQLTGKMIDDWYGHLLDNGTSAAEVNHIHAVFRNALRWSSRNRAPLPHTATDQANPPPHTTPEMKPPTTAAVLAVLDRLPTDGHLHWSRALKLVVFTGLRRGEVVGLRWDGWEAGRMKVQHSVVKVGTEMSARVPKGKRTRVIPLSADAERVLRVQRAWLVNNGFESPWVFPAIPDTTKPRPPAWLSTMWNRWRTKNAPGVRLHDLRHHYAAYLLERGTPLHVVQQWLGHAKASTTSDIYGHATEIGNDIGLQALAELSSPAPLVPGE